MRAAGAGRSVPGSTPWPTADPAEARVGEPSRSRPARGPPPRPGRRPGRPAGLVHDAAAPCWPPASPVLDGGRIGQRAIARSWPCIPDRRHAWQRCGAARGRSWTAPAPAGERSRARHALEPARSRSPPAPRTTDGARTAASTTARDVTVACRPPPGTNVSPEPAPRRRQLRRPRSSVPPRSTPKTGADPPAAPRRGGPGTATRLAGTDPNAAFEGPPQPPWSRCCVDHLNPPRTRHRREGRDGGRFGLFEGPEPWGPWATVDYQDDWLGILSAG